MSQTTVDHRIAFDRILEEVRGRRGVSINAKSLSDVIAKYEFLPTHERHKAIGKEIEELLEGRGKNRGPKHTVEEIFCDVLMLVYVQACKQLAKRDKTGETLASIYEDAASIFGYKNGQSVRDRVTNLKKRKNSYETWQEELILVLMASVKTHFESFVPSNGRSRDQEKATRESLKSYPRKGLFPGV